MLIVHTSDIHGKLTTSKAKKLLHYKGQGAILFDSGDALSSGNLDFRWREGVLSLMSLVGYAAGAVGNREFHPLPFLFKWKLKDANFPYLSANIISQRKIKGVLSHIILEKEGYRLAIIGLTLPQVRGCWQKVFPVRFSDPLSCGKKLVEELRGKYDFLIFLTHLGLGRDIKLAKTMKMPCLILGGHNHVYLSEPLKVNDCYIIHSGYYAQYCSLIELGKGKLRGWLEKL